jgi:hypothetical protein
VSKPGKESIESLSQAAAHAAGRRVKGVRATKVEVLSGADRDAFLAAVGRKPDPSPRLVKALKRHRRLFG